MRDLFGQKWYKGNLHAHTTASDGKISQEECAAYFKRAGYDFLCITDHRKVSKYSFDGGFLQIPGAEYDYADMQSRTAWHITAINLSSEIEFAADETTPEELIAGIREKGAMPVLAHPAWSLMAHQQILSLPGIEAIEVYNGISDAYCTRGESSGYVDVLATYRFFRPLLAVDDCHFYDKDSLLGFTMVSADELSPEGIIEAIRAGKSYASTGPLIKRIALDEKTVKIECSPLKRLTFLTDSFFVKHRVIDGTEEAPITSATYEIIHSDYWLRIEGEDFYGKKFWSNIIPLI